MEIPLLGMFLLSLLSNLDYTSHMPQLHKALFQNSTPIPWTHPKSKLTILSSVLQQHFLLIIIIIYLLFINNYHVIIIYVYLFFWIVDSSQKKACCLIYFGVSAYASTWYIGSVESMLLNIRMKMRPLNQ